MQRYVFTRCNVAAANAEAKEASQTMSVNPPMARQRATRACSTRRAALRSAQKRPRERNAPRLMSEIKDAMRKRQPAAPRQFERATRARVDDAERTSMTHARTHEHDGAFFRCATRAIAQRKMFMSHKTLPMRGVRKRLRKSHAARSAARRRGAKREVQTPMRQDATIHLLCRA